MTWAVVWTRPALVVLRRLDRLTADRVRHALRRLAEENVGDVARLQGISPPEWRLRVGVGACASGTTFESRTIQVLRI